MHSAHTSPTSSPTAASRTRASPSFGRGTRASPSFGRGARAILIEAVSIGPAAAVVVALAAADAAADDAADDADAAADDAADAAADAAAAAMLLPTAFSPGSRAERLRRLVSSLNMGSFSTSCDMPAPVRGTRQDKARHGEVRLRLLREGTG